MSLGIETSRSPIVKPTLMLFLGSTILLAETKWNDSKMDIVLGGAPVNRILTHFNIYCCYILCSVWSLEF